MTRRRIVFAVIGLLAITAIIVGLILGDPTRIHHFSSQI